MNTNYQARCTGASVVFTFTPVAGREGGGAGGDVCVMMTGPGMTD